MIDQVRRRWSVPKILMCAAFLAIVVWWAGPVGYYKVHAQCRADGGLKIVQQIQARGAWIRLRLKDSGCAACRYLVMDRTLDYADFESVGSKVHGFEFDPGFYRMSLEREGHPSCVRGQPREIPAGECLAMTRLPTAPEDGYAFFADYGDTINRPTIDRDYWRTEYTLTDVKTNEAVASYRQYRYALPAGRLVGGTMDFYSCPDELMEIRDFLRIALGGKID